MIREFITRRLAVVALASGALLSACTTPQPHVGVIDRLSAPYVEAQHQYHFPSGSATLSNSERSAIHKFLSRNALREGDVVIVTIPTSGAPKTDALRHQTMRAVLSRVPSRVRLGMDQSFASHPTVPRQLGIIRIARAQGIEVNCTPGPEDMGCANAINLAVMIHEPGDVLAPATTARTARQ